MNGKSLNPPEAVARETFRIVLVENDDDDAFFIIRALQKAGLGQNLTRFTNGQAAVDYLAQLQATEHPDVVLLDLKMPGRNGFDVLNWLRQQSAYESLPVLILSSSDEPGDVLTAKNLRASQYLMKQAAYRNVIEYVEGLRQQRA